jgi:hypothetical protein
MLCAYVLNDGPKWDKHIPLAEFSYNNNYQESIKMSPFETLYGQPYCTPLSWFELDERVIFGPDIVTKVEEKVKQIRINILTAQSRQKSYTDKRRRPLEFEVGGYVYLRVSPMKGVCRFGIKGKLARYLIKWSNHREVWTAILSSGATIEAIGNLQRVSRLPTQKMYEAPN